MRNSSLQNLWVNEWILLHDISDWKLESNVRKEIYFTFLIFILKAFYSVFYLEVVFIQMYCLFLLETVFKHFVQCVFLFLQLFFFFYKKVIICNNLEHAAVVWKILTTLNYFSFSAVSLIFLFHVINLRNLVVLNF